jgi:hypothetical protein
VSSHASSANINNEKDYRTSLVFFTNDGGKSEIWDLGLFLISFLIVGVAASILRKHQQ